MSGPTFAETMFREWLNSELESCPVLREEVVSHLLESDALTGNHDGTPEFYTVDAENVDYLADAVLAAIVRHLGDTA